jgi:hypothetical protein
MALAYGLIPEIQQHLPQSRGQSHHRSQKQLVIT